MISNQIYKSVADLNLHKRVQEFLSGDEMIIRVRPKRFPPGTVQELHTRRTCP